MPGGAAPAPASPVKALGPVRTFPLLTGRRLGLTRYALTVQALATAALVARDGTIGWTFARLAVVGALAAAGWWLLAARRVVRGTTLCGFGFVGCATGAGIGVLHVFKGAIDGTALAGLATLGMGVILLMVGVVTLVRGLSLIGRILAVPVGYLVLQLGVLSLVAGIYATNLPPIPLPRQTPASVGLTFDDVGLTAADGVHLAAWYVPSRNRAAVVLLHGSGSTRAAGLPQAAVLAAAGYGVLLLDARGHGGSGGDANEFGWYGDADIAAAVGYLAHRPDVDPARIGAVGLSMGGEEAIGATVAVPALRAVVAEGVTGRVLADRAFLPHTVAGFIMRAEGAVMYGVTDVLSGAKRPIALSDAVRRSFPRRFLLISGSDWRERDAARRLRRFGGDRVQVWEVPDAEHTGALAAHHDQWRERVVGFLDRELDPDGG